MAATQDCHISKITVTEAGLTTESLDIVAPSPVICMQLAPDKLLYAACESGTLLVLSLPSTLLHQWSIDPQVIQLVLLPDSRLLLSSLSRACILQVHTGQLAQVGSKERKGDLGACRYKDLIIAARPNGFLWKANMSDGKVISTVKLSADEGGKLAYGRLYAWRNLLISYRIEEKELLLLDLEAGKLLQSTTFPHKTAIYKSFLRDDLYRLTSKEGLFLLRQLSTKEAFHLYVQKRSLSAALELVQANSSLWDLQTLKGLCELVFGKEGNGQGELVNSFRELVGKLELQFPLEIEIVERKCKPDQAFMARFASYKAHQMQLKATQIANLAYRKGRRRERLEAAKFIGLRYWSQVRLQWKSWLGVKIPLSLLTQGFHKLKNPKIRLLLQANLQRYGKYMGIIRRNRGVEELKRVREAVERYREHLKVAKQSYDRETYTEVREILLQLALLQNHIL